MKTISYQRHSFHPDIIMQAVWLYFRFTMSYRDVEELLAERGIEVSYETVRRWVNKFGKEYAKRIKRRRPQAHAEWFLDEVSIKIGSEPMYLWRAVDGEGEVLDVLDQKRRNKRAALKLLRKLLQTQGVPPTKVVTDKLKSYGAALRDFNMKHLHDTTNRLNNRAESSHVPIRRRERKMQKFKSHKSSQIFLSAYGPIYNLFNTQRHLISRQTLRAYRLISMTEWNLVTSAD